MIYFGSGIWGSAFSVILNTLKDNKKSEGQAKEEIRKLSKTYKHNLIRVEKMYGYIIFDTEELYYGSSVYFSALSDQKAINKVRSIVIPQRKLFLTKLMI